MVVVAEAGGHVVMLHAGLIVEHAPRASGNLDGGDSGHSWRCVPLSSLCSGRGVRRRRRGDVVFVCRGLVTRRGLCQGDLQGPANVVFIASCRVGAESQSVCCVENQSRRK